MAYNNGPTIVRNGLVLALDAADKTIRKSAFYYRWWTTVGGNPTTKAGFDAFFTSSPQSFGITYDGTIDWLTVSVRPSYITTETQFAWEVTGWLFIDVSGQYIFNTRSDDGNELQINDQIITSFYGSRGVPTPGDISSPINLSRGYHKFQYRMQQGAGGAGAQVRWQIPGSSTFEVIPAQNFAVTLDNDVFVDITQNKTDGLLFNGVSFNTANGGSLVFDGVDDYIATNQNFTSPSFTYEVWLESSNISKDQMYVGNQSDAFYIRITSSRAFLSISANGQRTLQHTTTLQNNTIYQIVSIYNGVQLKIYVNGQLTNGDVINQTMVSWGGNRIGRWRDGDQRSFVGRLYSIKAYDRELTPEEILQNYNATKGRYGL
jgi:hypothetical protein